MQKKKWSKFAIWGFILSIISILILTISFYTPRDTVFLGKLMFIFWILSFLICFVSIVFCLVGIRDTIKRKLAGKPLAIIGIIINAVALAHALWYIFKPSYA